MHAHSDAITQPLPAAAPRSPLSIVYLSVRLPCHSYQLATGGSENVVKLWDVRKKQSTYTLPAHSGLISAVKCVRRGS